MYIAFEGIDGSGKTTQIKHFCEWLDTTSLKYQFIPQPMETTECGKTLRKYLREGYSDEYSPYTFALLFAANRAEIHAKMDRETLPLYLTDRCLYSNLVYSNLSESWFDALELYSPIPDYVILFDIDPEVAVYRCDGDEKYESKENLKKVRERYLKLAERYKDKFFIIEVGDKDIRTVHEEVKQLFLYGGFYEGKNE